MVALKSFYMAAEFGYVQSKGAALDGANETLEAFQFDVANLMTYAAMAG